MTTGTRRRLDRLAQHMAECRNSAAATATATATGVRCHDDAAHVAQVLDTLAQCGALAEVLERAGLAAGMVEP